MSLLPDANELVQTMKKAAVDAVDATKPTYVYFGEVTSALPLEINVEQKMTLGSAQLILTRNVTDFETEVTVNWETESILESHTHPCVGNTRNGGEPLHDHVLSGVTGSVSLEHAHAIVGKKTITIHNSLTVGDQVILLRQQGGQKFVVVDRIGQVN